MIRTAFKENNVSYRHRNVAKLLFIHMLGYPSHFGQMECLKLIASPNFPEKRIGYLALMLLLDERTEVLTLVTNSIKNDLSHPNQFVVGLALASVGNLATGDMGRILIADADRCLRGNNPYLKKKAALVMIRIFKRVPEMIEEFADKIVSLLKERMHGVLIAGVQLMVTILELEPGQAASFARLVPSLVRLLRNLLSMGYSPEHDVAGITDPFLQVKLLRLLQLLGHKNEEASDAMNDILAQVATNTETSKNAGNAILYECVKAIMTIEGEAGLRILAVNILGRFLLNRDNNIRYVALSTLSNVVVKDMDTVQRHRSTIVECLKDPDISIRQRALELIYLLTNSKNVVDLMREMLNYLVVASSEQKPKLCSKIMDTVDKYAPSRRWRVDTLITMLSIAGNQCDESIIANTIMYVTVAEELHPYTVHKLFNLLTDELTQRALIHVGVWCVGEYGNYLLEDCPPPDSDGSPQAYAAQPASAVCALLESVKKSHMAEQDTRGLVLTAFAKLSQRLGGAESARIAAHLQLYKESLDMELQQRSVEFSSLVLGGQWDSLRPMALGSMPPMDEEKLKAKRAREEAGGDDDGFGGDGMGVNGGGDGGMGSAMGGGFAAPTPGPAGGGGGGGGDLLDLDDLFGGAAAAPAPAPAPAATAALAPAPAGGAGMLDIMGGVGAPAPAANAAAAAPPAAPSTNDMLADIFSASAPAAAHVAPTPPAAAASPMDLFGGGAPVAAAPVPASVPMQPVAAAMPMSNPTITVSRS
jgi:AP-1 complex subunit gamma-1